MQSGRASQGVRCVLHFPSRRRCPMRICRTLMALIVLLISPAFAQSPSKNNPSVKETLRWMQTTLENGHGDYNVGHDVCHGECDVDLIDASTMRGRFPGN